MRYRQYKEGSLCLSPSETRHQLALVVQVLLHLLPHVKDGTVPTEGGEKRGYSMSGVSSGASDEMLCCVSFTLCRARPRGGNPDSAGTESTGERNAPPVCSGDRSLTSEQRH